jgi:hypothetical protein
MQFRFSAAKHRCDRASSFPVGARVPKHECTDVDASPQCTQSCLRIDEATTVKPFKATAYHNGKFVPVTEQDST